MTQQLEQFIDQAWENRVDFSPKTAPADVRNAVAQVIDQLNKGTLRVAQQSNGEGIGNQWAKKALRLSVRLADNVVMPAGGSTQFYVKVPSKFANYSEADFAAGGFRVVPPAIARHGSFIG